MIFVCKNFFVFIIFELEKIAPLTLRLARTPLSEPLACRGFESSAMSVAGFMSCRPTATTPTYRGTGMAEHNRYALDFIEALTEIKRLCPGARTCSIQGSEASYSHSEN